MAEVQETVAVKVEEDEAKVEVVKEEEEAKVQEVKEFSGEGVVTELMAKESEAGL